MHNNIDHALLDRVMSPNICPNQECRRQELELMGANGELKELHAEIKMLREALKQVGIEPPKFSRPDWEPLGYAKRGANG